jgi:trans-aconitate methyltransferase
LHKTKKFSWNPTDYAKNSENQLEWARELILKLKLQGNETLLDIGCGDGKITAEIAQYLPKGKVIGIDSSVQMVNLAKTRYHPQDYPNLDFVVMDACNLTFKSEFDIAFSNAALHWIGDQKAVLSGVTRVLNAPGYLLFQMGGKGNAKDILRILDELLREKKWSRFFEKFTFPYSFLGAEEYRTLLAEAGLEPQQVELVPKIMKLKGSEGLAGWIRTTWLPYTERLPAEMRADFVKEIVNRYLRYHPADNQGIVRLSMVRLEVKAIKL